MQCLPVEFLELGFQHSIGNRFNAGGVAVNTVAHNRIAAVGKMHADLMRASGFDFYLQKSCHAETLAHLPESESILAMPAFCGHLFAIGRMPADRQNYFSRIAFDVSPDERQIFLVHIVLFKLR